jgi:hypothetical protein
MGIMVMSEMPEEPFCGIKRGSHTKSIPENGETHQPRSCLLLLDRRLGFQNQTRLARWLDF